MVEWSISLQPQEELAAFARFGNAVASLCVEKKGARACLKNHFRNLQAPLCGIFYPQSVAVARYAPYSDKISHELGLAAHEKPFSDTLYSGHAGSGTGRKKTGG